MARSALYYFSFIAYLFILGLLGEVGEVIGTTLAFLAVMILWSADRFNKDHLTYSLIAGHSAVITMLHGKSPVRRLVVMTSFEILMVGPWLILNIATGWTILISICAIAFSLLAHFILHRKIHEATLDILKKNNLLAEDGFSA